MYLNQTTPQPPAAPLRDSVQSGQVSLAPETGDRLTKLLNAQIDMVEDWLKRSERLSRPAPLGTNPVATAMSEKFTARADGDETSFLAVLTAYREVLYQTQDAVSGAIRNFSAADDEYAQRFRTQVI